eukprot:TRINITY_DN13916_c0_g1_i2.p1 TRINITY_DN13916_c0_g1~~TRINITY_DN13916_c0_g1_i2.p1  ORF type:complete len:281 (-),score=37.37 TRINITY_DN13916_c0_g1_i2:208-1050(-)
MVLVRRNKSDTCVAELAEAKPAQERIVWAAGPTDFRYSLARLTVVVVIVGACLTYLYVSSNLGQLRLVSAVLFAGLALVVCGGVSKACATNSTEPRDKSVIEEGDVLIHVYDLANSDAIRIMNNVLLTFWIGGAFHAGLEVYGQEWCYGYIPKKDNDGVPGSGAFASTPRSNAEHGYRLTIYMGRTSLGIEKCAGILERLTKDWADTQFDTFHHNCLHFCNAVCIELGLGPIPAWLDRGQRIAGWWFGSSPVDGENDGSDGADGGEALNDLAMEQAGAAF